MRKQSDITVKFPVGCYILDFTNDKALQMCLMRMFKRTRLQFRVRRTQTETNWDSLILMYLSIVFPSTYSNLAKGHEYFALKMKGMAW